MENVKTTTEVAETLGVSVTRVHRLIFEQRIKGARKVGARRGTWLIPVDEEGMPTLLPPARRARSFQKIQIEHASSS